MEVFYRVHDSIWVYDTNLCDCLHLVPFFLLCAFVLGIYAQEGKFQVPITEIDWLLDQRWQLTEVFLGVTKIVVLIVSVNSGEVQIWQLV